MTDKASSPKFQFKRATSVAVGTFNMYIVQPAWLAHPEIGILASGLEILIESKLDEPGFRYSSPKLKTAWTVTPSRIILETEDAEEDCGATMAKVLRALPWTPLRALGTNAQYETELQVFARIPETAHFPITAAPPAGVSVVKRSYHTGLKYGGQLYNLHLSENEGKAVLETNVHTEMEIRGSEFAQQAAQGFLTHRKTAESFAAAVFKVEFEHAQSNN